MKISKQLEKQGFLLNSQVKLLKKEQDAPIKGMAGYLSQGSVFIKTKDWQSFQVGDPTILSFLPSHNLAAGFQSEAIVQEIDQENEGVMVEFVQEFKQPDPANLPEISGKARYKKLAFYLMTLGDVSLDGLIALHPHGFLVEKSRKFLDESVIFQFSTEVVEDQEQSEQLSQGVNRKGALGARVMEIEKRKNITSPDMIAIGRSPENDIVLYNRLVSKSHAFLDLSVSDETIFLIDNFSTNGTFVNNIELSPTGNYRLADGDEISFGPETKVVYFSPKLFHSLVSGLKSLDLTEEV
jgi:hypothetical protein